jgi:hypothetical protein
MTIGKMVFCLSSEINKKLTAKRYRDDPEAEMDSSS